MLTQSDIRGIKYLLANASTLKGEDGKVKTLADLVLDIRNDLSSLNGGDGGDGGDGGSGGSGGTGGSASVSVQLGGVQDLLADLVGINQQTLNMMTAVMVALCEPGDGRECAVQIMKEVCDTPLDIDETIRTVPDTIAQRRAVIVEKQEAAQVAAKSVAAEKLAAVRATKTGTAGTEGSLTRS